MNNLLQLYEKKKDIYLLQEFCIRYTIKLNFMGDKKMELIFVFLGAFITSITLKKVIEEYLIGRIYTKKTARIIGFENPVYNAKDLALSEGVIYPILEVQEKNKIIKLIIPIYQFYNFIFFLNF